MCNIKKGFFCHMRTEKVQIDHTTSQSDQGILFSLIYEPAHDQTYNKTLATSEDSDQTARISLISLC